MSRLTSSRLQAVLHWRYLYIVNSVLILLVVFTFGRELLRSHDIDQQIQSLKNQSAELQTQNTAISELHDAVQTETYIEREARLKLGLKKPGETLVIVKDGKNSGTNPSVLGNSLQADASGNGSVDTQAKKPLANSTKWWYYFFNKQAYRDSLSYDE